MKFKIFIILMMIHYNHNHILYHHLKHKTVRIMHINDSGAGSGFIYKAKSKKIYILTNRHVCDHFNDFIYVRQHNKLTKKHKILFASESYDICLIDVKNSKNYFSSMGIVWKNMQLFNMSFPGEEALSFMSGTFISHRYVEYNDESIPFERCFNKYFRLPTYDDFLNYTSCYVTKYSGVTTITAYYGSSGSPIFNYFGLLVGMTWGINKMQHIFYVPVKDIDSTILMYENSLKRKK